MAALSAEEYRSMSEAAYETVSRDYRETAVFRRLLDTYRSLGVPAPEATAGC
jgi:hypothetical protein